MPDTAIAQAFQKAHVAKGQALEVLQKEVLNLEMELPWKFATHFYDDTDSWGCKWGATRFIAGKDATIHYVHVRSGESLPESEQVGFRVLHMDTGLGELDQHGQEYSRTSSFKLMCEKYGWLDDEALRPILELTVKTDNVEEVGEDSVHYALKNLPYHFRDKQTKEVDWDKVREHAFVIFDGLYGQHKQKIQHRKQLKEKANFNALPNGVRFTAIPTLPQLRGAAYENGADVVAWTEVRDWKDRNAGFNVGIQVHLYSPVTLDFVMLDLLQAEAKKRDVVLDTTDLIKPKMGLKKFGWFLHASHRLIVCGSRSHPLAEGEQTQLRPYEIVDIVRNRLMQINSLTDKDRQDYKRFVLERARLADANR